MTAKHIGLLTLLVAIVVGYIYTFSDWFSAPPIQIVAQIRRLPGARSAEACPVSFTMDRDYHLTRVKVIDPASAATNRTPAALWHLASKVPAPPVRGFLYGDDLPGLKPIGPGSPAVSLMPGTTYRLLLEAGRARGQIDFQTTAP